MPQQLTLDTLADLSNGAVGLIVNRHLAQAINDVEDRGAEDEQIRKVVITVSMKKVGDEHVKINVMSRVKLPDMLSGATIANLEKKRNAADWNLTFESASPENPDQPSMFDKDKE